MPLPVAHALLGASVAGALNQPSQSCRWKLLTGALLGICPDFDYALNWLRISGGGWHHGFTHSILFALVLGLIIAYLLRDGKARSIALYCAATLSHTLLDFMMTESRGVALWWPFTDRRYKLRLPNPIDYTWSNASLSDAAVDILMISLTEFIIFGPILMAVVLIKKFLFERAVAA
ncbi:MAG: metal-dependent hydrolase [Pyrinomonadaceae bacterium]